MPGQLIRQGSLGQARGIRKPARWFLDPTDPLSRGLVSYWPLGDVAAGVTRDVSPYGRHAAINIPAAAPVLKPSHHGGFAFNTNASTPYCSATTPPAMTYPLSFSIWANLASLGAPSAVSILMCLGDASSLNEFWLDTSNGTLGLSSVVRVVAQAGATQRVWQSNANAPATGTWHHYVGIFRDSGNLDLYIDGVVVAGNYQSTGSPSPTGINTAFIGALVYNGVNLYGNLNGSLEGGRIYNRIVSPPEVARLCAEPNAGLYEYPSMLWGGAILQNNDKPFTRDSRLAYLRR